MEKKMSETDGMIVGSVVSHFEGWGFVSQSDKPGPERHHEDGDLSTKSGRDTLWRKGAHAHTSLLQASLHAPRSPTWLVRVVLGGCVKIEDGWAFGGDWTYESAHSTDGWLDAFIRWCMLRTGLRENWPKDAMSYLCSGDESGLRAAQEACWNHSRTRDFMYQLGHPIGGAWHGQNVAADLAHKAANEQYFPSDAYASAHDAETQAQSVQIEAMLAESKDGRSAWKWRIDGGRIIDVPASPSGHEGGEDVRQGS